VVDFFSNYLANILNLLKKDKKNSAFFITHLFFSIAKKEIACQNSQMVTNH